MKRLSLLAALALSACIHRPAPVRLATPVSLALAVVYDRDTEILKSNIEVPPEEVGDRVQAVLEERNVGARLVTDAVRGGLTLARDSAQRMRALNATAADAKLLLLAETKVVFYELLQGRYKWTVFTKFTVARKDDLSTSSSLEVDVPVFLLYDHERELEALRAAAPSLAERAGTLVDNFLRGRPEFAGAEPNAFARPELGSIYFILLDRFANGDRSNDANADLADQTAFHGGDLQGVLDRLDWLQALGVQTLWLSPVFQMRSKPFFNHGAFHGYWVEDINRIEPRFGNPRLLRKLSDELHARGMKLLLDVVLNHVAMDAPLTREHPEWFHNKGAIADWSDPRQLEDHDVHGLPDLAQEREDVYRFLLDASLRWIDEVKPDGFRLDAVKHVPLRFWQRYVKDVKAHAGAGFWLLGEALDGEPHKLAALLREGGFDALFDFPLKFAVTDVFCKGRPPGRLAATLDLDRLYTDAATQLVTLLDNHDLPRVLSECGGDAARVKDALTVLLAARGIPSIQYGTEVGLTGAKEPENRGDMRFVQHPLYAHLAERLKLRREHPVLSRGAARTLSLDETLYAQLRALDGEGAILIVNRGETSRRINLPLPSARAFEVAPRSVLVEVFPLPPAAEEAWMRPPGLRAIELAVTGAPVSPGDSISLVGAGPELGSWDPKRGVSLLGAELKLRLRAGAVYEFKLVIQKRDGSTAWEAGEDRFLFVPEGPDALRVDARWRS